MVATRRGARTDHTEQPDHQDASLTLRKKPVRRATAATAATAAKTSQPAPKPRATRSKKTTEDQEDELAGPAQPQEASQEPESSAKRTTRSKRAETVEPESIRSTRSAKPTPQPKRATRTAPVQSSKSTKESQSAPAATTKPALAARPARQTRAKTPVAQSSPLSPKKITQVSRARTRGAKITEDEKAKPARNTRAAPATKTSSTSRKRTVSDENAGIPNLGPVEPAEVAAESVKAISPSKKSPVKEKIVDEEEPLSSRATTPSVSSGPSFEQPKDYTEDKIDAADLEQSDNGTETADQSASDDELCGPKTPMRRTRKAQSQASRAPESNTKLDDLEVPLRTPPRRRGARGRTPQTQKSHDQTATSESVARPMTVARANDRPFVFRKLREDTTPMPRISTSTITEADEVGDHEITAEQMGDQDREETDDAGLVESEDEALDHNEDGEDNDPDETIVLDENVEDEQHGPEHEESIMIDLPDFSHDLVVNTVDEESSAIDPPILEEDMDEEDSSLIEPPTTEYDDGYGMELDSPTAEPPVASYEVDLDGSVIVHSRDGSEPGEDSEGEDEGLTQFGSKTPRPETIPWQNIREDVTIPIDFDLHFADVRSPARVNDGFSYDAASGFQDLHTGETDLSHESDRALDQFTEQPTINLNDFVDMAALTEPTLHLDTVSGAANDGDQEASNDESSSSHVDDNDSTVIITEIKSPVLPTSESTERQDATPDASPSGDKLRSGMMEESLQHFSPVDSQIETDTDAPFHEMDEVLEEVDDELVPHYALSTLSSRRKSLPAFGHQTPTKSSARPITSDGSSIARVAHPFDESWWTRSRRPSAAGVDNAATPVRSTSTRRPSSARRSTVFAEQESSSVTKTPTAQPGERFPRRTPRDRYDGQSGARTVAAPSRFRTPEHAPVRYPATAQKLSSQQTQQPHNANHPTTSTPAPVRKSFHDGENEQAKSFEMPFRVRTPASTPKHHTASSPKGVSEGPSGAMGSSAENVSHTTPQERFPRRSARQTYDQQASTVAAPARFHTPIQGKPRRPATVQRHASQLSSQASASSNHGTPTQMPRGSKSQKTPSAVTPSAATPTARFPRLPPKDAYEEHVEAPLPATPQARFPRLPPKQTYDERASTVVAPSRFRSPAHASPRRPVTSQKPVNLRKVALKSAAPSGPHTPMKTPLKAPGETPSQVPMTPHPGAPLRGVLALVEVFTLDGASASAPFISLLQRLGARTTKSWSERVTHVIFKDGSPTTLQRVRLNNKEVESSGKGFSIHCVNSRWVSDCDASGSRVDEDDDAYAVDVTEVPRGGNRRRKSMEPSALVNIGGNIVRDRKSSGRQSIGRSAMKMGSLEKESENDVQFTPVAKWESLQDDDDFEGDESELSTPDYLSAPDKLVQMTAPSTRVRKLDLQKDASKNRRMTSFWEGGEHE
jgi:hypothetical protein